MTSLLRCCLIAAALVAAPMLVLPAGAQPAPPARVLLSGNGGVRTTTDSFGDSIVFDLFAEKGDFKADYEVAAGAVFDGGGIVRLWRNVGAGVSVSVFDSTDAARIAARIPHPFFFDQPRAVTGLADGLLRREIAVHVQGAYLVQVRDWVTIAGFAGPTFFSVNQDLVQTVRHIETGFPFDAAAFGGHRSVQASESSVGVNLGVDASFFPFPRLGVRTLERVGVGFLFRYSLGDVEVSAGRGDQATLDLGGAQFTGGVRIRF